MKIDNFEVTPIKGIWVATIEAHDVPLTDRKRLESIPAASCLSQEGMNFLHEGQMLLTLSGLRERVAMLLILDRGVVTWGRRCV